MSDHWFKDGLKFECLGCGECCKNHSEYEYVYLTETDIQAICLFLEMSREDFLEDYCIFEDGMYSLIHGELECPFLIDEKCRIYDVRPKQCSTWPFWTENLEKEKWEGPVKDCCPGVGKGKVVSAEEILKTAAERDVWYLG